MKSAGRTGWCRSRSADGIRKHYYMVGAKPSSSNEPVVPTTRSAKPPPAVLRTRIYFHRTVHDQLRAIAFEKRKSVAGVIHEALDDFLRNHGFPTTEELKRQ